MSEIPVPEHQKHAADHDDGEHGLKDFDHEHAIRNLMRSQTARMVSAIAPAVIFGSPFATPTIPEWRRL
jgi:hypothetical protein